MKESVIKWRKGCCVSNYEFNRIGGLFKWVLEFVINKIHELSMDKNYCNNRLANLQAFDSFASSKPK